MTAGRALARPDNAALAECSAATAAGARMHPSACGSGAVHEVHPRLANHTIYRPADLAAATRPMPVVVWGNGGRGGDGTAFRTFLLPLAAMGVLVIASSSWARCSLATSPAGVSCAACGATPARLANGVPGGTETTNADMLRHAIDFAVAENSRTGSTYEGKIDITKVSAMGQSSGGLEAVTVAADPRVGSAILWNSGIFPTGSLGGATKDALDRLHGPVAWLHGGPTDIAYTNAVDDYARVPASVPALLGGYRNVGHAGLFLAPGARPANTALVAKLWIDATLYGDVTAKAQLVGSGCGLARAGWTLESKNW